VGVEIYLRVDEDWSQLIDAVGGAAARQLMSEIPRVVMSQVHREDGLVGDRCVPPARE